MTDRLKQKLCREIVLVVLNIIIYDMDWNENKIK
jgi:hypothetical protein